MVSAKKRRVSKKTKTAGRKHGDITDVEEFLEDKRQEERLGDYATKKDEELFVIDTAPREVKLTTKQKKRARLATKVPKCFSMLQPHTKVPDPLIKRNHLRTKEQRETLLVKHLGEQKLKEKVALAQESRAIHKKKKQKENLKEFDRDLWAVEDNLFTTVKKDEWLKPETKRNIIRGHGVVEKSVKRKKTSFLPPVEVPHPGTSYNPSFKDHQNLLKQVVEDEMKVIKEENHLNRVTTKMFSRIPEKKRDAMWLVEMSQGLNDTNETDEGEDEGNDEYSTVNPPVVNKKKDRKTRRKQKEQQELELQRKASKIEKKKIADIYKLKQIGMEIAKQEVKSKYQQEKKQTKKESKKYETGKLSKVKFEKPDLEFTTMRELSGNLRGMKSEGNNLLRDRFKSLQKRNILEPTIRRTAKKAKVKKFEKATHKMGWEPKGY